MRVWGLGLPVQGLMGGHAPFSPVPPGSGLERVGLVRGAFELPAPWIEHSRFRG